MEVASNKCHEIEEIRDIFTCAICLELFDNARLLSCSHSFCISCLRALCLDRGTEYSPCPQCRKFSIPPPSMLDQLPEHEFGNKLADLVREQDEELAEAEDDGDELFVGKLLQSENKPKRSRGSKVALAMLKGVATVASLGIGGIYLGVQAAKKRRQKQALIAQNPHESFVCGCCRSTQIYSKKELRFKCGMCEDFNLCETCAVQNPSRVHRQDHLLIKLKFKQKRQLPPGCLLKYRKARDISEEIDSSTSVHGRAYYHTPERIKWTEAISCSYCARSPITGTRFKCGMCRDYDLCEDCEACSQDIHDKNHVFIVLQHRAKVNIVSEPLIKALVY